MLSGALNRQRQNTIDLDAATARQTIGLVDSLEDNDDVQEVYANFDISDEIMTLTLDEEVK
ncbi:hypothetical protein BH23ACT11_BH23ACT11_27050 [soil metagenome]